MSKFSELSAELDSAITEAGEKKAVLEKLNQEVQTAANSYQDSLNKARALKSQMDSLLAETFPESMKPKHG